MEVLWKIYTTSIFCLWFLFNLPLFLVYLLVYFFIFLYYKVILIKKFENYTFYFPNIFEKFLFKVNIYLLNEVENNLPRNLVDWFLPENKHDNKRKEDLMKAIDVKKSHDFICKSDLKLDKSEQTIFQVRYLTAHELAQINDDIYQVSGVGAKRKEQFKTGSTEVSILKKVLLGWSNFKDSNNADISFDKTKMEDMIDMVPAEARREIVAHVRGESEISEGEG